MKVYNFQMLKKLEKMHLFKFISVFDMLLPQSKAACDHQDEKTTKWVSRKHHYV